MRFPSICAAIVFAVAPGWLMAGDEAPISALAALTPTATESSDAAKSAEKPSKDADSDRQQRRRRPGRTRRPHAAATRSQGARPMFAQFREEWGRLPDDMKISITKTGKEPAEIAVTQGDKSWSVKDSNLQDLPPEVRGSVAKFVGFGLMSKLHALTTDAARRPDGDRPRGRDSRESRRHHGHRHHAHQAHHRGGDRRRGDHHGWGERRRHEGFGSHAWFSRSARHDSFAHQRGGHPHQLAIHGSAYGSLGHRLALVVSRLERLAAADGRHPASHRPAGTHPLEARLPGRSNWFGQNQRPEEHRHRGERDETAELRQQIERLQQQQERMANALRELSESLSRSQRN